MTNHTELFEQLAELLKPIAKHHGEVLYSPVSALRPNEVYLLGYNPGAGGPDTSVLEHLAYSMKRTTNAWLDEKWGDGVRTTPLQKRMTKLFESAKLDLRMTPSSNLIFTTSKRAGAVNYDLADTCWPAHQLIMNIVQPKKLIVFGNGEYESPYSYIRKRYPGKEERYLVNEHYCLKRLTIVIDGRDTEVFGIPHLSRFPPKDQTAIWLAGNTGMHTKLLSNSDIQKQAEDLILHTLSYNRGWQLEQEATLPECPRMKPDGIDFRNRVICEVYARIGKLRPGPQRKLAKDILKLNRMNRKAGGAYKLVMAFASHDAASYLLGSGWVAQEARHFGIEVVVVDLPLAEREKILAAQERQAKGNSV